MRTRGQQLSHLVGSLLLHRWQDVRVGVERHGDAGVPEPLGCDLGVYPAAQQQRRGGVPEIVEPQRVGEPRLAEQRL
jgi:hypothetical protein